MKNAGEQENEVIETEAPLIWMDLKHVWYDVIENRILLGTNERMEGTPFFTMDRGNFYLAYVAIPVPEESVIYLGEF